MCLVRAEAGIATALVRTERVAGLIKVRAGAPALKDAVAEFRSKPDPRRILA